MTTQQDYFGKDEVDQFDAIVFAPQDFTFKHLKAVRHCDEFLKTKL